jgi:PAS domain-containing protein
LPIDTLSPPVVLIAGEGDEVRVALARTLRAYGVRQIDSAPRARALAAAARIVPDVILIVADEHLKEPTTLVTELRASAAVRDTPVLVRLSRGGRATSDALLMAGADKVLVDGPESAALAGTLFRLADVSPPHRAIRDVRRRLAPLPNPTIVQLAAAMQDMKTMTIAADARGRCMAMNDGVVTATAFARDDIIGRAIWDILQPGNGRDVRTSWETLRVVGSFQGTCLLMRKYSAAVPVEVYIAAHVLRDVHVAAISSALS